jgi:hypothetical protein
MFIVFVCNLLFLISDIYAKPLEFGEAVLLSAQDIETQEIEGQESHPYQVLVKAPNVANVAALEEVDDDVYEEGTTPVKVYAIRPQIQKQPVIVNGKSDLLQSASHHQEELEMAPSHHGHDNSGWLDMGAYSGGHGAFGWYADYPVGDHGR